MPHGRYNAALALGSNLPSELGGPEANLRRALEELGALGRVLAVSSFYETEPVGYTEQPRFLNAAAILETSLEPEELMRALLAIERKMGRDRTAAVAKGPRLIDLDLLLVDGPDDSDDLDSRPRGPDSLTRATPLLTLPHPEMHRRRFVLEPLAEIAAGWRHPTIGLTVAELLERLAASAG